jgi:hypothetical protein
VRVVLRQTLDYPPERAEQLEQRNFAKARSRSILGQRCGTNEHVTRQQLALLELGGGALEALLLEQPAHQIVPRIDTLIFIGLPAFGGETGAELRPVMQLGFQYIP